ncbi:MAG: hypothetical protein HY887_04465 [Deltaproteobacteria bacterium]|nr:hypothetical protein [Deltaproteobacteria bacterium]
MGKRHLKALFFITLAISISASVSVWAGDPEAGRLYFFGQRPFANSGPPCGKCHSVKGAGGGSAPELAMFCSGPVNCALIEAPWLNNNKDPKMEKSYRGNGITGDEAAALRAFLEKAAR